MSEQVLSANAVGRTGAVALALGSIASGGAAHASVIVTEVDQVFPASIVFNSITQFNISTTGPTISDAVGTNLVYTNGSGKAVKLSAGASIGPSLFTSPAGASSATLGYPKNGYFVGLDVHSGTGAGVDNYGYVQIALSGPGPSPGEVVSYGFETNPGFSITAEPVPEPTSLALLAVGVAGVLEIRRRPKRAAA